jgi:hypothetical protein
MLLPPKHKYSDPYPVPRIAWSCFSRFGNLVDALQVSNMKQVTFSAGTRYTYFKYCTTTRSSSHCFRNCFIIFSIYCINPNKTIHESI